MNNMREILTKMMEINVSSLSSNDLLSLFISISSLIVAAFSFIVSLIVLIYSGRQFFLKKGFKFYGIYSISSSAWSNQKYISDVIIENKKEKAAAISYIYLRIGNNIYLELVDYHNSPRIISPFETIKIELKEGVSGYISSTFKVNLDKILSDSRVHKSLFIATPQGISKVINYKKFWNVYFESLRNFFIIPVQPVRKYYKGKEYSDSLRFVVTNKNTQGILEEYFLYRENSYTINKKQIETDNFQTASELEQYLRLSTDPTNTTVNNPIVEHVGYTYRDFESYKEVNVQHNGFFTTHFIGGIYTKTKKWSLKIKNKLNKLRKQ